MRMFVFLVGLLLLSLASVSAGDSFDVNFTELRSHSVFMYEGDEVRFELVDGLHSVIIEDVGSSSIKLDFVLFIDGETEVTPGLVSLDSVLKVDLDRDGENDLNLALYSIAEDEEVNIVLQDATEIDEEVTGDVGLVEEDVEVDSRQRLLVLIALIILALVGVLFYRKSSDKVKKEEKVVEVQSVSDEVDAALDEKDSEKKEETVFEDKKGDSVIDEKENVSEEKKESPVVEEDVSEENVSKDVKENL